VIIIESDARFLSRAKYLTISLRWLQQQPPKESKKRVSACN